MYHIPNNAVFIIHPLSSVIKLFVEKNVQPFGRERLSRTQDIGELIFELKSDHLRIRSVIYLYYKI